MERYDCRICGENVFVVQSIEHLGSLPRTLTCAGCQTRYTVELGAGGKLRVYRGNLRKPKTVKATKAKTARKSAGRNK